MLNSRTYKEIMFFCENESSFFKPSKKNSIKLNHKNRQIEIETMWSNIDYCYFTISSNYKNIVGYGRTSKDSEKAFLTCLDNYLQKINKGGRPKKGNTIISCRVKQDVKAYIDSICKQYNINQGQFIAELVEVHKILMTIEPEPTTPAVP